MSYGRDKENAENSLENASLIFCSVWVQVSVMRQPGSLECTAVCTGPRLFLLDLPCHNCSHNTAHLYYGTTGSKNNSNFTKRQFSQKWKNTYIVVLRAPSQLPTVCGACDKGDFGCIVTSDWVGCAARARFPGARESDDVLVVKEVAYDVIAGRIFHAPQTFTIQLSVPNTTGYDVFISGELPLWQATSSEGSLVFYN